MFFEKHKNNLSQIEAKLTPQEIYALIPGHG
jgi:hypothetical protein